MKKVMAILILCFLSVFLVSCVTVKKPATEVQTKVQKGQWESGQLVFMGDECVGWFSTDLKIIGSTDIAEYLKKNNVKPTESEILNHFSSLGWETVGTPKKDKYTTEYQLRRIRIEN